MFMDMIEEMLILRGYNYRKLDGGINYDDRMEVINDFQTDPSIFIFLISTRAGGLGLNLTAADTVIFMDRDWVSPNVCKVGKGLYVFCRTPWRTRKLKIGATGSDRRCLLSSIV